MIRFYHSNKLPSQLYAINCKPCGKCVLTYHRRNYFVDKIPIVKQIYYLRKAALAQYNDAKLWYERVTGSEEVRMMQNRVMEAQDKFILVQEQRRKIGKELAVLQDKVKDIRFALENTNRCEERYIQLITQEHAILKEQQRLKIEFDSLEREERDQFNMLSICVKESHERERTHSDRTKYWSIIGSILGTVIGFLGSGFNNHRKMKEIRNLINDAAARNSDNIETSKKLGEHEKELAQLVNSMEQMVEKKGTDKVYIKELSSKLEKLFNSLQHVKGINSLSAQIEEIKVMLLAAQRFDGPKLNIPNQLENILIEQQLQVRLLTFAVALIGVTVPFFLICCR